MKSPLELVDPAQRSTVDMSPVGEASGTLRYLWVVLLVAVLALLAGFAL